MLADSAADECSGKECAPAVMSVPTDVMAVANNRLEAVLTNAPLGSCSWKGAIFCFLLAIVCKSSDANGSMLAKSYDEIGSVLASSPPSTTYAAFIESVGWLLVIG